MTETGHPRIALVGAGYWGKNIARSLAKIEALAAVVDGNAEQAQTIANQHGVTTMTLDEVLQDSSIEAVAIATPAVTHVDIASAAIRAGKDVFVEKPMALRPEEARPLVELAAEHGAVLMVGHLLQYHTGFLKLKEMVAAGELGRLQYLYSNRLNFGKIRREEDVLWSFAPHDISMILALAGEAPDSVSIQGHNALHGRIADVTLTHLGFPSGLAGHVFVSWLHPFKEQKLVVVGERGMAVFDDREPLERKLALYEAQVEWVDGAPVAPKVEPQFVDLAPTEPLVNEMTHFAECVANRSTPRTDGAEGLRVLEVLAEATKQLHSGASADPESEPAHPGVHETAVVDDGAYIGSGTKIWHFSHIMGNTKIGDKCSLGQNVVAGPNVTIGNGVRVQNNVSVYDGVTLEDDVFCGPSMVFTNVVNPRSFVTRKDEFAATLIKRGASLGANCTVVCGTTVGQYALVGAGAVVTKDVPDYALMVGVPARQMGWVSREGEILDEGLTCPRTGEIYEEIDGVLRPTTATN